MYSLLSRLISTRALPASPRRIVLIRPCCIGDVVMATATLQVLRRAFPDANITWAIGSWSREAIAHHPLLDSTLDTGDEALPVQSLLSIRRFASLLRNWQFDLAISLVRSPRMSLAVMLSGIPHRVGLDSRGRGFGYTVRIPVDPNESRHEADIYLDTIRVFSIEVRDCYANIPVSEEAREWITQIRYKRGIESDYIVIHPGGGSNPGMSMLSKRWLPENYIALGDRLADTLNAQVILLGGSDEGGLVNEIRAQMNSTPITFIGDLSFPEIGALAAESCVYIGNDTGLTHLAAASGAKTVMILGPTDPVRYAPFTPNSVALWKPASVQSSGVAGGIPDDWNWERDGISVDEAFEQIMAFIRDT